MESSKIERLKAEWKRYQADLVEATGGESVCSIHKHGMPSHSLKYSEGVEIVLRDAVKHLAVADAAESIEALLTKHEAAFNRILNSPMGRSEQWAGYARGGLEGVRIVRSYL